MAFKESYINEVNQQNQGINNISQGIKSAAVLALGISGFTGGLGDGALAKGAQHTLAGKVGGIGGNIMLASLNQKKESNANKSIYQIEDTEAVEKAFDQAIANGITNDYKAMETVWDKLTKAKQDREVQKIEKEVMKNIKEGEE